MKGNEGMGVMGGALLWLGAAVSIAEIFTGALLAPLGMTKGLLAILIGHAIGCILFYHVGLIGAKRKLGAMESTSVTFGRYGSIFFSVFNVLQLLGWTAVMIITGAEAMNKALNIQATLLWCVVIGALIMVWLLVGIRNISKLNLFAVGALFILSIVLAFSVFNGNGTHTLTGQMSFGLALELSIAMPVSWLPLISDYTKHAGKPVSFTLISTVAYFIGSCFMYALGLGAALYAGSSDVVGILTASGLGMAALLIALLSTVTTTYLDVYSAGESLKNIFPRADAKAFALAACLTGTALAIGTPMHQYEGFLLLIGSVFVPMAALLIVDFALRSTDSSQDNTVFHENSTSHENSASHENSTSHGNSASNENSISQERSTSFGNWQLMNFMIWFMGFIIYRALITADLPVGSTIPVILIVMFIRVIAHYIKEGVLKYGS